MTAVNQDIGTSPDSPYVSGDTLTIRVACFDDSEPPAPMPLSQATSLKWEVYPISSKTGAFYGVPLISKSLGSGLVISDAPDDHVFEISILEVDTADLAGSYYHEAEVRFSGGIVHTPLTGKWKITKDAIV